MKQFRLFFIGGAIFISILMNAFIGMSFFRISFLNQFNVVPVFFQNVSLSGSDYIHPSPFSVAEMTDHQRRRLTSQLIEEYIVNRYTILTDKHEMARRMGDWIEQYNDLTPDDAGLIQHRMWRSPQLWERYRETDVKNTKMLMKKNITRTVEILRSPVQDNEFWIVRIRLHDYGLDGTYKTSVKKIRLRVKLHATERLPFMMLDYPSLYFDFDVLDFNETTDIRS